MRLAGTATALLLCTTANAAPFADEVTALPGWPSALPSKQYSGFLDVGSDYHLHYVFVEASGADPSTAPLVLCMQHPLDLHQLTERDPTPGSRDRPLLAKLDCPLPSALQTGLNGGPGASSFGYGYLTELGPFSVRSKNVTANPASWERLEANPKAWTTVANVLFLESPSNVGFSYCGRAGAKVRRHVRQPIARTV